MNHIHPEASVEESAFVHARATVRAGTIVGAMAIVEADVRVGPGATVEEGATVGTGATVEEGATVGTGATVGAGAYVGAGARIADRARLGPGVRFLAGDLSGHDRYGWSLATGKLVPVLTFGCEVHPLPEWTEAFQAVLCKEHAPGAPKVAQSLRKVVQRCREHISKGRV